MVKNMGSADRIIRTILGIAFVVMGIVLQGWVWVLAALGVVLLVTAIVSFCPIYALLKISTRGQVA